MNEIGCDADGPFLIQRQCDELGSVFAISGNDIDGAGPTRAPVTIDDQVKTARVAADLGVVQRRPAGTVEVYWIVEFDAQAF